MVKIVNIYTVSDKNSALSLSVVSRTIECKPSDSDLGIVAGLVKLVYFRIRYLTTPSVPKIM